MQKAEASRKIEARKRGNRPGFWFFRTSVRLFGLRGTYGFLYIVCLYYALCDRSAISAALSYVDRRFPGSGFLRRRLDVYRLFVSQGKQLIDRYAAISALAIFDIRIKGYEQFMALVQDSRQGLILLTAHVGNWQIAMTTLKDIGKTVYLLMRPEDNPAVQDSLHISREQVHIKIISPEQHLGGVVEIMNVLREGHVVSIMGDRSYGFNAIEVSFLGEKAWFPHSAFSIAAAAGCPVVVLLSVKVSAHRYVVDVSNVLYPRYEGRRDKREQLQQWVQKFVAMLERYINQYPYQCFLFHNVWREESKSATG
ncbi:MAG: lysophospholipid acyltransferase family protein [Desulfobacterales bacterium]|nr:lysophospholipid acyltransferase family protein [Desulfobacterales bacterium]